MKLLKCNLCSGEVDIIGGEHSITKKIKCRGCKFTNSNDSERREPEVVIIRKRIINN